MTVRTFKPSARVQGLIRFHRNYIMSVSSYLVVRESTLDKTAHFDRLQDLPTAGIGLVGYHCVPVQSLTISERYGGRPINSTKTGSGRGNLLLA